VLEFRLLKNFEDIPFNKIAWYLFSSETHIAYGRKLTCTYTSIKTINLTKNLAKGTV